MKLMQVIISLIVLWFISMATVYVLSGWGPVEAVFEYAGQNAVLKAGSLLGAVVVVLLVLSYVFGQLAKTIGLQRYVQTLLNIGTLVGKQR